MQPRSTRKPTARSSRGRTAVGAWGNALPTPEESSELKRNSIIRAAAQCFNRSGFHATSMDDIAARLGVTKPALYRYVKNKHELLFAAFNMAMDASVANLEIGEKNGANGLDKLRIALRGYIRDLIGALGHPVVLLEDKALLPEQQRALLRRRDHAERRFRGLIAEGIADGSIEPCDPKLTVFAVLGAVNWVPKWYRPDGEWSVDEIADNLVNLFTRAIAARPQPLVVA
jgi:TetR/AcrR family transcriptional regulator